MSSRPHSKFYYLGGRFQGQDQVGTIEDRVGGVRVRSVEGKEVRPHAALIDEDGERIGSLVGTVECYGFGRGGGVRGVVVDGGEGVYGVFIR